MIIHVINLKGSQVTQPFIGHKISFFDFEHRVNQVCTENCVQQ